MPLDCLTYVFHLLFHCLSWAQTVDDAVLDWNVCVVDVLGLVLWRRHRLLALLSHHLFELLVVCRIETGLLLLLLRAWFFVVVDEEVANVHLVLFRAYLEGQKFAWITKCLRGSAAFGTECLEAVVHWFIFLTFALLALLKETAEESNTLLFTLVFSFCLLLLVWDLWVPLPHLLLLLAHFFRQRLLNELFVLTIVRLLLLQQDLNGNVLECFVFNFSCDAVTELGVADEHWWRVLSLLRILLVLGHTAHYVFFAGQWLVFVNVVVVLLG